ncbi:MAG TPA: histidine triad nucleotide-binding protein [Acidobacteriota bacterium]|jgi:histidine triad (HIT) family protein
MDNCLFCKISTKEIQAKLAYEDERVVAFYDINPQAPTHILVVPRKHIASLHDCTEDDAALMGHALIVAKNLAEKQKLSGSGYRVVLNTGQGAGQSVFHIHFHLLGGRSFKWPPG